jgi:phosphopantothenoylcysteine decarboxylase / phosphopantothenate---cysteine ligase
MPARVIFGVGAGIAAYKACELLRLLTESGYRVRVVPTQDALRFVGEATWAALSGEPVTTDVWTGVSDVPHVRLGQSADLVIVAPATADLLARAAAGMAGDLLAATLLTARCPVLYAPAMHTEMWEHPATQANVALLGSTGPETRSSLAGRRVVVSAGGTREEIDPVRFIGNWSTGTQGFALARTAVVRGADVTVVAANVTLADPAGAQVIRVVSALQMRDAITAAAAGADAIVMAAAVADYRPEIRSEGKIKKDGQPPEPLRLVENPDILAGLAAARGPGRTHPVLVGFAAETDTSEQAAKAKLARKGCDLLVVNPVGHGLGFGTPDNEAVVFGADGTVTRIPRGPKEALANVVWDLVAANLK